MKGELLPRFYKEIIPTGVDLFLVEILLKNKKVSQPAIVIEHMTFVINVKARKNGLPYGLLMNSVLAYFNIECGQVKVGPAKKIIGLSDLEENKYMVDIMGK